MISRRRREYRFTEADMRMRAALGDANIIAWYDARFPWTVTLVTGVSAWADARRATGLGPSLVQATEAAQPAYGASARTVTFDGTDDYLRVDSTVFETITAAAALIVVGTLPTTGGANTEEFAGLATSGGAARLVRCFRAISNGNYQAGSAAAVATVAAAAGRRVIHGRRTAASGGNVTAGARIGSAAEGTTTAADVDVVGHRLTIGAHPATSASIFADVIISAVLVIKGTTTTAMQNAANEWARNAHGATI